MLQTEFIGKGSITHLKKILNNFHPKNIFLVTGKASYGKSGAKSVLNGILNNYNAVHFFDFYANPKIEDVEKGLKIFRENNCDFVIAVGGGSVIDTAKLVNIFAANPEEPVDYIENRKHIENKGAPLAAIPTTSGSGSEVTQFAVVNIGKKKCALTHEFIIPDYAIIDSNFTMSLPKYQSACTGMDALGQAVESYWCVNSTEESKKYAAEAIKLVMDNLTEAVNTSSEESREAMAKAAYLAGRAINISKTTACHAISYPITSYFNVPHGHAVALTLALMLAYNSQVTEEDLLDKRGIEYVKNTIKEIVNTIGAETVEDASEKITNLMNEISLGTRLSEVGIKTNDDIKIIIKEGFNPDRVKNNPRKLTKEALRKILEDIR